VRPQRAVIESEAFRELWGRIKARTVYRVDFESDTLIKACVRELLDLRVERARVVWEQGEIDVDRGGVAGSERVRSEVRFIDEVAATIPDVVGLLQERSGLTRSTVARILTESNLAGQLRINPQQVVKRVGDVIDQEKQKLVVDGIKYERTGALWAQELFDREFERDLTQLMKADKRCTTDQVVTASDVERRFLTDLLAAQEQVKLYAKLPREFVVPTPLGNYEPDWAVLVEYEGQERLYLIVETKSDSSELRLRGREAMKIDCGKAHFKAVGDSNPNPARFMVASTLGEVVAKAR